ncbi:hypothetical protein A4S06_03770 [Erysipelotrichaceae bacterium MTC7]|nr:hypothetical protein A4S06_03770 [Erysipelotrichaceae bacterium MTC7]
MNARNRNLSQVRQPQKFDYILALIIALFFVASIVAIAACKPLLPSYLSMWGLDGVLTKQILFYILGIVIIAVIIYFGNDNLFEFAKIGYFIFLAGLIYLFLSSQVAYRFTGHYLPLASAVNGSTAWLQIPLLNIQPSEFMKVMLIVISAYVIEQHNEMKEDDSFESDIHLFIELLKWIAAPAILILLQPDTGIFILILFSIMVMVICSGIRREWLIFGGIVIALALVIFLYLFYFNQPLFVKIFGNSYKIKRIYGWLYPEEYATGVGLQLYSSLLAMGSGGLLGHGFQANLISFPEPHTDFIFAVIGMNFGLLGNLFVVGLCVALDVRLFLIVSRSKNNIEKLMVIGFLAMFIIQQLENIGMVVGLLPITGITLPLVSAGGSSMLSFMIAFGIIMNASLKAKKLSDYVY